MNIGTLARKTVVASFVFACVCAVAATGASAAAPEFRTRGGGFPDAIATAGGPFVLKSLVGATRVEIKCETIATEGAQITGAKEDKILKLYLEACHVVSPVACEDPDVLTTVLLLSTLEELGVPIYDRLFPASGEKIMEVSLTGEKCAIVNKEGYKVKGSIGGEVPAGEVNQKAKRHRLVFTASSPEQKLTFGGEPATLEGTATLEGAEEYEIT